MTTLALLLPLLLAMPQRPPEPFASHAVPTQQIAISPNDAFAAIVSNATAIRMDPRTQKAEELAERGNVASVALGDDSYTLGLRDRSNRPEAAAYVRVLETKEIGRASCRDRG